MSILKAVGVEYAYKNKYRTVKAVNGIDFEFERGRL